MGFIASDAGNGSNFKRVPAGVFIGRCYQLIDMGTQESEYQGEKKFQHKIKICWELFGEDDQGNDLTYEQDGKQLPMTISKNYTMSLHEKAGLRKDLAAWRGRDFTDEEARAFDVSKLLGAYCMVNVTTSENNGKTYSNVAGLTPLPGALKNSKPAPGHTDSIFNLDDPDLELFETFHDNLKEKIKASPEWHQIFGKSSNKAEADVTEDDEIPF